MGLCPSRRSHVTAPWGKGDGSEEGGRGQLRRQNAPGEMRCIRIWGWHTNHSESAGNVRLAEEFYGSVHRAGLVGTQRKYHPPVHEIYVSQSSSLRGYTATGETRRLRARDTIRYTHGSPTGGSTHTPVERSTTIATRSGADVRRDDRTHVFW